MPQGRAVVAISILVALHACAQEDVIGVSVQDVTVIPPEATILRDDSLQLSAIVRDEQGVLHSDVTVTWTSTSPSVASVSSSGVAKGLGVGPVTIEATFGNVTGTASLAVLGARELEAEPPSASLFVRIGRRPDEVDIEVRDPGGGSLEGLETTVAYPQGQPSGWLDVEIDRRGSRLILTLTPQIVGLSAGIYLASVVIQGPLGWMTLLTIPVSMTIVGF